MRTKNYNLSTLSRIEVILGNRYCSNHRQTSGLEMLFKLITLNGETKKIYLLEKEFRIKQENTPTSAQIKQQLISLRDDFENNFRNLKILFPNIISLKEENFPISYWQMGMGGTKRVFFFYSFWFAYFLFCSLFLFLIYDIPLVI